MVGYMLTAVGGAASGFFFLDYYRAHDAPKGRHIFTATALLVSLMVSLSLVNWVIFGLYGQVAAYTETYSILYPAVVAGDLLAPWLFGVLLAFWGGSLIRFSHDLERKSPAFRVVKIAGSLFLIAAVLTILIPALNIAVAVSLMGDDVFNLYGVWLLNEVVFSPLNLALVWAGSILTTVSWRSSTTLAT
jgi:hypothetical protein